MKTLKAGTRGSQLALIQTRLVTEKLKQAFADIPEMKDCLIEEKVISTKGDKNPRQMLAENREPGFFSREIHEAVIRGEVDFAVHSAKDLPAADDPETRLMSILPREDPADVLIFRKGEKKRRPKIIGTSSPRRQLMLSSRYPKAKFLNIRGNVATRLEKLASGQCDALALAAAGLKRLALDADPRFEFQRLNAEEYIPAACQGIIALEIRRDSPLAKHLEPLIWTSAQMAMDTERKLMKLFKAGCQEAAGAYVEVSMRKQYPMAVEYDKFMAMRRQKLEKSKDPGQGELMFPDADSPALPGTGMTPQAADGAEPYVTISCFLRRGNKVMKDRAGCYYDNVQKTIDELALGCLLRQDENTRDAPEELRNRFALLEKMVRRAQSDLKNSAERLRDMLNMKDAFPQSHIDFLTPDIFGQSNKILPLTLEWHALQFFSGMKAESGKEIRDYIEYEYEIVEKMESRAIGIKDFLATGKTRGDDEVSGSEPENDEEKRIHEIMMAYAAYLIARKKGPAMLGIAARISEKDAQKLLEKIENS
ncbi:MAG: hydroxymethylbilane synthase [Succinivibrionaceae bacterium]|nr:hydroxymethylbilane synthase [Succinivibrionaceae bacterium]